MGFFQSPYRARLPLRAGGPIFGVGRRVCVGSPAGRPARLTSTDDGAGDALTSLVDGTEVGDIGLAAPIERHALPRSLHARRSRRLARSGQRILSGAYGRTDWPAVSRRGPHTSKAVRDLAKPRKHSAAPPLTQEGALKGVAATVEFQGVKVVAESERALCCRIAGRDHWIPPGRFLEGTSVAHFGDRGAVVVTSEFAGIQGLLLNQFPPL